MERLVLTLLEQWKDRPVRLPLLIRGARQVGKTWLVREHARSYENFVEINLESQPEYLDLFKSSYGKPEELIKNISLLGGKKIEKGKTLLFLDEIQVSKEALLSLRYFKENLPEQHVIAAGSLLEFTFKDLSFPVGRIEFFHLFPMNFEEYLLAVGRGDLVQAIFEMEDNPIATPIHEKLLEETTIYSLLGGLPAVIKTYVESSQGEALQRCQEVQQILMASFREDFHKYASRTNVDFLRILFQGIPRLLGQKLKYSNMDPHIKSRELSSALNLLEQAGIVYKAHHSSASGVPLESQIDPKKFKVFFLDIGLCQRVLGLHLSELYLQRKELLSHRGGIAEQFVAQEILSYTDKNRSPKVFYWHREARASEAELDLLIEDGSTLMPIEVKSHKGHSSKSLSLFLKEKKEYVGRALRVSTLPYGVSDQIISTPFYGLMRLFKKR
ncbi:MAG: ATP-binding protein [Deltaproteobacteria bacterium]|nr:ATP-binding protein [Deltaproteobacteria bacterium]